MATKKFPEIDNRMMKLIVGIIAISLPIVTNALATVIGVPLTSISASYWIGGATQTIFTGSLFAIASFLIAYNGLTRHEMFFSKVAAAAAVGVAMFPCDCGAGKEIIPKVHYLSAGIMFAVLTYFCCVFLRRAIRKGAFKRPQAGAVLENPQATMRAIIYCSCAIGIILFSLALAYNTASGDSLARRFPNFVFWGEAGGLWSFGISWLTASHTLPFINRRDERFKILAPRELQPPVTIV